MALLDIFRKKEVKRAGMITGYAQDAPDRDVRGLLSAYNEIYSLFGIVLRIATAVGEVKWRLYKGSERSERSQVSDHPILKLLDYANEFQTGQEIIELLSIHMDLTGRGYWWLPKNGLGVPGEIWVIPPHLMKPVSDKGKFIAGYVYQMGFERIPFDKNEIIRFPMPDPLNQLGGTGYAQAAVVELDTESYAGKWNRNFFYNSARPDGAILTEEDLTPEQFEQLKQQWQSRHGGLSKAHKVAILEGGMKYQQIQMNQKDMDFASLRKSTRENLMFAFGMPQSVMGVSENVNKANAEAGDYTFARWLIKPRLTRIKNKLNEALLPMFPKAQGVEIDFDEVVPETIEQKKALAETGVKTGFMTINEGRKINGLDPISGGDVLLIPLNMIPSPIDSIEAPENPPEPKSKGFTDEQKDYKWKNFIIKTQKGEFIIKRLLQTFWKGQAGEVISNIKNTGSIDYLFSDSKNDKKLYDRLSFAIDSIYYNAYDDAEEEVRGNKQFGERNIEAEEWIKQHAFESVKSINQTTKERLRKTLREGFINGEDSKQLSNRVLASYKKANITRARTIARTETIAASNQAALLSYKNSGIKRVEFYVALDERTCEDCMEYQGKELSLSDAEGLIPIHPNCRCTYIPLVMEGDVSEIPEPAGGLTGDKWKESLNRDEKQALSYWQGSGYERIREAQQSGKLTGSMRGVVKNMESALSKAKPYKGEVFRGINSLNANSFKTISNTKQFKWNAFSSGASNEKAATRFLRGEKGRSVMFRIQNKTGVDITPLLKGESEVLMKKNATFNVISKEMKTYTVGKDKFDALEMVLVEV